MQPGSYPFLLDTYIVDLFAAKHPGSRVTKLKGIFTGMDGANLLRNERGESDTNGTSIISSAQPFGYIGYWPDIAYGKDWFVNGLCNLVFDFNGMLDDRIDLALTSKNVFDLFFTAADNKAAIADSPGDCGRCHALTDGRTLRLSSSIVAFLDTHLR